MACLVLNMCELMKGAQHWKFFHVYIICMCRLRNHLITQSWPPNFNNFKTGKKEDGTQLTQFVFCRCIIRFFFSVVQKKKIEIDLAEGFQMIHVNGRRHCQFEAMSIFLANLRMLLASCRHARKVDF